MSIQAFARRHDPQTSRDAAASVVNLGRTQDAILFLLSEYGPQTDEKIADMFYTRNCWSIPRDQNLFSVMVSPSGLRSRRAELVRMGKIETCGIGKTASGRNCHIWRAVAEPAQM